MLFNPTPPAAIGTCLILAAVAIALLVAVFVRAEFARGVITKNSIWSRQLDSPGPAGGRADASSFAGPGEGSRPGSIAAPKGSARLYASRTLTTAEGRFYDFLSETVNGQYVIQPKVPLRDLFRKYGRLEKGLYTMHSRGHVDFLLLERVTKQPVLAIELDYTSHDTPKGRDADMRKEELLKLAHLPLCRVRVGKLWGSVEQEMIREALGKPGSPGA
jgi:Protein of unknown function (DUF2726)